MAKPSKLVIETVAGARRSILGGVADRLAQNRFGEFAEYRDNWAGFGEEVLGNRFWHRQLEILDSVRDNARTVVPSGHANGKTWLAADIILTFLNVYPDSQVISTAPTGMHVEKRLWAETNRMYTKSRRPLPGVITNKGLKISPKWEAFGVSTDDPNNFQGGHAEHLLIVFDEAQGVKPVIWTAAEGMMNNPGARWLLIGNPIKPSGLFYDAVRSPHLWNTIRMNCEEHPNVLAYKQGLPPPFPEAVSGAWVEEREQIWGRDSGLFRSRVLGLFPEDGDDVLITSAQLERCIDAIPTRDDGIHMGVDVARFGADQSRALVMRNRCIIDIIPWEEKDCMQSCGLIIEQGRKFDIPPENWHVDVIGLGAGIVDRLKELGYNIDAVNFGGKPEEDWAVETGNPPVLNRRAELYWALRHCVRTQQISIPKEFGELWEDITDIHYDFNSQGKIRIEAKDDLRERLGRSPDSGDALALALSRSRPLVPQISYF